MQIHEMFQRKPVTEVDLAGPSGIFNVGKEVLKDPKALWNSNALGAAKQRAADQYGKAIAPQVAKLAQANITPVAKQLAQGWKAIGSQLHPPIATPATPATKSFAQQAPGYKSVTINQPTGVPTTQYKSPVQPTSGALKTQPVIANTPKQNTPTQPSAINSDGSITVANEKGKAPSKIYPTDPSYKSLLAAIQKSSPTKPAQPVNEDAAGDYRQAFIDYAHKTLGTRGVDTEAMAKDANTNIELNRAVDRIIATYRDPAQQQTAVEQYFTTALTKWNELQQDPVKYNKAFPGGQRSGVRAGTGASATPGSIEQELKDTLSRLGITSAQLTGLAAVAKEANRGSTALKSTGNPVWDAILKSAGMDPR